MRYYKNHDYNKVYKSSPELVTVAIVLAYVVISMSVEEISRFFGF